jgi:phage tail-like protein
VPSSDQKTVSTVSHFKLDLGGPEGAMLFSGATIGAAQLNTGKFATVDDKGNPVNSVGGGTQVQWGDLNVTRGVDSDHQLYEAFKDVKENGATADNAKEIKLIGLDAKGETLFTWNFTGAHISSFQMGAFEAGSNAILTESASFTFEDATLEA